MSLVKHGTRPKSRPDSLPVLNVTCTPGTSKSGRNRPLRTTQAFSGSRGSEHHPVLECDKLSPLHQRWLAVHTAPSLLLKSKFLLAPTFLPGFIYFIFFFRLVPVFSSPIPASIKRSQKKLSTWPFGQAWNQC